MRERAMSKQKEFHVVELEIRRFYRVYVECEEGTRTKEIEDMAREIALQDEQNLELDEELGIEPHDILGAHYEYAVDG